MLVAALPQGKAAIFCPELSRSGAWTVVKLTVRLGDSGGIARLMAIARNILGSIEKGRQLAALVLSCSIADDHLPPSNSPAMTQHF
jgi:hypothetical protein